MGSNLQQPMASSTTPTPGAIGGGGASGGAKPKKSVQTLLGEHSNLVNLDNLVSETSKTGKKYSNLFLWCSLQSYTVYLCICYHLRDRFFEGSECLDMKGHLLLLPGDFLSFHSSD